MKSIFFLVILLFIEYSSFSQLFSSGNSLIGGSNIGIGVNTPVAKLHIMGNSLPATEFRIQHTNFSAGSSRLSFFNDSQTVYSATANYALFIKYAAGVTGFFAPNFPFSKLFTFGNAQGDLLFSSGGNIGFGYYDQATSGISPKLLIHANGKIGIGGNEVPRTNAHFNATTSGDTLKVTNSTTGHTLTDGLEIRTTGNAASIVNRENSSLVFGTNNSSRLTIDANGNVIIGTTTTPIGYKLYVETGILTEKIKVAVKTSAHWSDYVFAADYQLKPLKEVETFILKNKHLPGIPSAMDVVANGLDLAKMDAALLEKIEELTLHLIRMEKEIDELKKENFNLQVHATKQHK